MTTDDLVNVLVPKKYLSRVYGLIAELEGGTSPQPSPAAVSTPSNGAASTNGGLGEWTPKRIRRMVHESPPAMKDVLRALAERPGEWLTTDELVAAMSKPGADWNTLAGTLGACGRRVKNRYALETMPFEKRYDHDERCKMHRMPPEIAEEVQRYLANGD